MNDDISTEEEPRCTGCGVLFEGKQAMYWRMGRERGVTEFNCVECTARRRSDGSLLTEPTEVVQQYHRIFLAAWKRTGDILADNDPAHFYAERLESMLKVLIDYWEGTHASEPWEDNLVQFARLLDELAAVGAPTEGQMEELQDSMDLGRGEINELFDRAMRVWESAKRYKHPYTKTVAAVGKVRSDLTSEQVDHIKSRAKDVFQVDAGNDSSYAADTMEMLAEEANKPLSWWLEIVSTDPDMLESVLGFDPLEAE